MKISEDYYLGKDSAGFYIWNSKKLIRLISEKFVEACAESRLLIKTK